jgi:hypothetical protein
VLSILSSTHDSDVQMYPKQVRLWGMISSQSLGYQGYARDCHLHISSNRVGGCREDVPRRNGPMLTPGTSAYVAGIFPLDCPDASYLMCWIMICVDKGKDD